MASAEFDENSEDKKPTVQVGIRLQKNFDGSLPGINER